MKQKLDIPSEHLRFLEKTIEETEKNVYFPSFKFPPELERIYQEERSKQREKEFILIGIISAIFYNLFTITDKIMLPDVWNEAFLIRIGIITPLMIVGISCSRIPLIKKKLDILISILIIIVSISIIVILFISNHPNVLHYYSGIVLVLLCGNIVFRINFKCATFCSLIVCVTYFFSSLYIMKGYAGIIFYSNLLLLSATTMSLIGNFYLEKNDRIKFLLNIKLKLEKKHLQEANFLLEKRVKRDPLTKLYNRAFFDNIFEKEWMTAMRYRYPISIIFLDIDDFKSYNDNYSHQAGDYVLKKISMVLKNNVKRFHEIAARYGGEEFVVLLPHIYLEEACKLAEKIRREVEELNIEHQFSAHGVVTVSIGVCSTIPRSNFTKEKFLLKADEAMYHSKKAGKNRVTCCNLRNSDK